jgi:hypothetical protein
MSDPTALLDEITAAEDAFGHTHGRPDFEPELNSAPDASAGEVQIQKACRFLELTQVLDDLGAYYAAILEHPFIVIEHTLQGYLLAMTGTEASDLRDHTAPYEFAKGQVPLETETIESLQRLHDARRTQHYYGTTVTTEEQAERMRAVAAHVHRHIVAFDHEIERFCFCSRE